MNPQRATNRRLSHGKLAKWGLAAVAIAVAGCWAGCSEMLAAEEAKADAAKLRRPNVVIILADDLGWADLGCYGNTFNVTPQIDRLAKQGLRFTQFYAGPVCSPTRANLQSGLDQARFGITQHIPGHRRPFAKLTDPVVPHELPLSVQTFAESLAAAGYATGYFGKWHLGGEGFGPREQGWQTVAETRGNTLPARLRETAHTDRTAAYLTEQACDFIAVHKERPFVMQVSHGAVHIPLTTTPKLLAKYQARQPMSGYPSLPAYAALLQELDDSVGGIVAALEQANLADQTVVIFLSDNGGLEHEQGGKVVTSNRPLRGEKGTLYEGGIRVPAVVRWPGHIAAGKTCGIPATTMDLYPTLLALAAAAGPAELDGVSLLPLLAGDADKLPRDTLCWHLPHYHHSTPASAIRRGNWKLLEFFEDGKLELYNLQADLGEQHNLAASEPERARELQSALAAWRGRIGARMPVPNPNYDPARAKQLGKAKRK